MFKRSPFKDAEVNPNPPRFDFMDRVRLTIGFFWFHHRTIVALLLVGGLGFWIYRSSTRPPDPTDTSILQKPEIDELPVASLEFFLEDEKPGNLSAVAPVEPNNAGIKQERPKIPLETGSASELIEKSLNIRDKVGAHTSIVDFMLCSKRAKISRRLMEMELTPTQRIFALVSYIESISMVDSLNVQGELNIVGPRAALLEVGEKYSTHPDVNVSSNANLAMLLAPAYDFLTTGDAELLQQFRREFDSRIDTIINDRHASSRLLITALFLNTKVGFESITWPVSQHILRRFEESTSPEIKKLADGFREQLFFGKLDLNSLVDRIEIDDTNARQDVQKLFEALAVNPDSRLEIYLVAVAAIGKYQEIGRQDEVQSLITGLKDICGHTTKLDQRAEILEAIEELEK